MKNRDKMLNELADLRKDIARIEPLTWSRSACPREVVESVEKIAALKLRADELERRIADEG